jgi:hypothetical protein
MSLPDDSPLTRRRARVLRIRKMVAAIATAVFIALFATIYIQMAAGKDPALGTSVAAAAPTQSSGAAGAEQTTDQPAAVTTSQS